MKIELQNPELEQYITEQVNAGNFPTPEAVIENLYERANGDVYELSEEDEREIDLARQEADRGETVDFNEFAARIRKQYGIS